jgi:glutathione S-transferase
MAWMRLYVGNKNYSSWSLRAGLLLAQAGIAFEEVKLSFSDASDPSSKFKREIYQVTPAGRVPALVDGDVVAWDSLAIAEYVAEKFPEKKLWPADRAARARARSLCAEMHSGFGGVRNHFPMNIEFSAPEIGPRVLAEQAEARSDLTRIDGLIASELALSGGPMLFGRFGIADAYFAPVASRIRSYGLPVSATTQQWVERIHQLPAMSAWVREALEEHDWVFIDEPYRDPPPR